LFVPCLIWVVVSTWVTLFLSLSLSISIWDLSSYNFLCWFLFITQKLHLGFFRFLVICLFLWLFLFWGKVSCARAIFVLLLWRKFENLLLFLNKLD
jgi:hypothetical protein